MKPAKVDGDKATVNEIVARLSSVPKTRLRLVHDVVRALAETAEHRNDRGSLKGRRKKSLLKTPFCGMWEGRSDVGNGQSYATKLRRSLEHRGDRI